MVLDGESPSRCAAPRPASSRTWRRASTSRPRRRCARSRQAARGQPPDPQQPARAHRRRQGRASRTSSATRCSARSRDVPAHELELRRRRRQAGRRAPPAREPRARGRRRRSRDGIAHAARAEHQGRRHARLRRLLRARTKTLIAQGARRQVSPDDFAGTTVSITNPGMIGTCTRCRGSCRARASSSASARSATRPSTRAPTRRRSPSSASSKVITLTSTYDHRIIQGAESGEFLRRDPRPPARRRRLLRRRSSPASACRTSRRAGSPTAARFADPVDAAREGRRRSTQLINMYRVRGHLIANLDPLGSTRAATRTPSSTSRTTGLTIWDLDREFPIGDLGAGRLAVGDAAPRHPRRAARRVRAHGRRRVHAHPGARPEGVDPGAGRGRRTPTSSRSTRSAASSSG